MGAIAPHRKPASCPARYPYGVYTRAGGRDPVSLRPGLDRTCSSLLRRPSLYYSGKQAPGGRPAGGHRPEQAVAGFIGACRWSDLPDAVRIKARFCLLDDVRELTSVIRKPLAGSEAAQT